MKKEIVHIKTLIYHIFFKIGIYSMLDWIVTKGIQLQEKEKMVQSI